MKWPLSIFLYVIYCNIFFLTLSYIKYYKHTVYLQAFCVHFGGHLVNIESKEENIFIQSILKTLKGIVQWAFIIK